MCDVIRREKPDYVFHLGDHDSDAEDLRREFPMLPISGVRGNCDWHSDAPLTLTVLLGGHRFFLCHGHTYGVKSDPIRAIFAAREQGADFLLYGHTHRPMLDEDGGLHILNPGACGYESCPTCARVTFTADGQARPEILECKC